MIFQDNTNIDIAQLGDEQKETQNSYEKKTENKENLVAAEKRARDRLLELKRVRDKVTQEADAQHEKGNDLSK